MDDGSKKQLDELREWLGVLHDAAQHLSRAEYRIQAFSTQPTAEDYTAAWASEFIPPPGPDDTWVAVLWKSRRTLRLFWGAFRASAESLKSLPTQLIDDPDDVPIKRQSAKLYQLLARIGECVPTPEPDEPTWTISENVVAEFMHHHFSAEWPDLLKQLHEAERQLLVPEGSLSSLPSTAPENLTEPLTRGEIASFFSISRNNVSEILQKYYHVKILGKFRMRVADMPPKYTSRHATLS